ncbi:MAG: hypothetical protein ABWY05_10545 [Noviherbaspirillum sp.]
MQQQQQQQQLQKQRNFKNNCNCNCNFKSNCNCRCAGPLQHPASLACGMRCRAWQPDLQNLRARPASGGADYNVGAAFAARLAARPGTSETTGFA